MSARDLGRAASRVMRLASTQGLRQVTSGGECRVVCHLMHERSCPLGREDQGWISGGRGVGWHRSFASGPEEGSEEDGDGMGSSKEQMDKEEAISLRRELEEELDSDEAEEAQTLSTVQEGVDKDEVPLQMPGTKWIELSDLPKAVFPLVSSRGVFALGLAARRMTNPYHLLLSPTRRLCRTFASFCLRMGSPLRATSR